MMITIQSHLGMSVLSSGKARLYYRRTRLASFESFPRRPCFRTAITSLAAWTMFFAPWLQPAAAVANDERMWFSALRSAFTVES